MSTVTTETTGTTETTAPTTARRVDVRALSHDAVLLVARVGLGILMIAHAAVMYDFGGGISGVSAMYGSQGIPLSDLVGPVNVLGEFFGGIAVILGLATRLVGLYMVAMMAGAWIWVHTSGLYAVDGNGPEMVIALGLLSLMTIATGSGRFGVDHLISRRRRRAA